MRGLFWWRKTYNHSWLTSVNDTSPFKDKHKKPARKGKKKAKKFAYKLTAEEEEEAEAETEKEKEEGNDYLSDSDESYMCLVCGAAVSEKAKSCPKCGTELE